jgi:poly(A) polymerase
MDKITPENIDPHARDIIQKLQEHGFSAYVVGGGVRDRMVGLKPKDFDIATSAHPEEIKALFDNCRLIGHRFRLAHIFFRRHILEVATFRGNHTNTTDDSIASTHQGIIVRDNVYGTLEEDVFRRDFTINALYYDPVKNDITDLVGGLTDLKNKVVRIIGDPNARLKEDPVRILRAVRIANKLSFAIDPATVEQIPHIAPMLVRMPPGRLFDEYTKLFLHGQAMKNFDSLQQLGILPYLFSNITPFLSEPRNAKIVELALLNTDNRLQQQKTVNPAFLFSVFLWPVLNGHLKQLREHEPRAPINVLFAQAVNVTLSHQVQLISIPRQFSAAIRQIWGLQHPLEQRHPKRIEGLLTNQRFRAAYDFMLLRIQSGELPEELGEWWTAMQELDPATRAEAIQALKMPVTSTTPAKRRRRRKPR